MNFHMFMINQAVEYLIYSAYYGGGGFVGSDTNDVGFIGVYPVCSVWLACDCALLKSLNYHPLVYIVAVQSLRQSFVRIAVLKFSQFSRLV